MTKKSTNIHLEENKTTDNKQQYSSHKNLKIRYGLFIISIFVFTCLLYNFKFMYSWLLCNIEDLFYTGVRIFQHTSTLIISLFPSLTEYYKAPHLIQNPFFVFVDMDCWPCNSITSIRERDDFVPSNDQHTVAPFIYKTDQDVISLQTLEDFYSKYKEIIDTEAPELFKNGKYWNPYGMFQEQIELEKALYVWKFNTINVARLLSKIIPRPKVVPKFGQSTERYIIIHTSQSIFEVPNTECNFSFLSVLSGNRIIDLKPAEECKHQCKALQIELKQPYLLWYNWWYWRPTIRNLIGTNDTFIAHVGSYC